LKFSLVSVGLAEIHGFEMGYRVFLTCVCWPG